MSARGPKRGVCVYCGSSLGSDPRFAEAADQLGAAIAGMGARLVFGGGGRGLMGRVARATMAAGGEVVGNYPQVSAGARGGDVSSGASSSSSTTCTSASS